MNTKISTFNNQTLPECHASWPWSFRSDQETKTTITIETDAAIEATKTTNATPRGLPSRGIINIRENSESEEEHEPEMAVAIREPRRGQDQAPHRPHTSIHRGSVHGVNPHRDGPFRGGIHPCSDKRCRWSPRICRCRCAQTTNVPRRSFRRATWGIG